MLLGLLFKKQIIIPIKYLAGMIVLMIISLFIFSLPEGIIRLITAIIFSCTVMIIVQHFQNKKKILKLKVYGITEYLGKRTYGLYVLSGISIPLVSKIVGSTENGFLKVIPALLLTILLAIISYNFFESKILELKQKFR